MDFTFCGLNTVIVSGLVCTEYSFFILFMPKAIWFVNLLIFLLEVEGWWVGHKTLPVCTSPDHSHLRKWDRLSFQISNLQSSSSGNTWVQFLCEILVAAHGVMVSVALVLADSGGPLLQCLGFILQAGARCKHTEPKGLCRAELDVRGRWRSVSFLIWLLVMVWLLLESLIIHHWAVWVAILGEMSGK